VIYDPPILPTRERKEGLRKKRKENNLQKVNKIIGKNT
jgi:hypothetical protein